MSGNTGSDDEEIITACLQGDRDRFSVLVDRYKGLVYSVAYRLTGDQDKANDAAQECFISAYIHLCDFRFGSKFSTWLYTIVLNKCRDQLRQEKDMLSVDDIAAVRPSEAPDPEQEAVRREVRDDIQLALDALPPDYREVLVLKHIQGLEFQEISRIAGASVSALKVRAHRGRELLRAVMEKAGMNHG